MLKMPLHLLDKTLPFIRVVSSRTGALLSPDYEESGEPIPFGEYPFWHEVFTFLNHFELRIVNELYLLLHTAFIALTDNGNNEIHEYNIADNQNDEPEEPCQDSEVTSTRNDWRCVVITDGLPQYNYEICSYLDSFVIFSRLLDNYLGHNGETCNHNEEEKEKDKELFENNDQHSYQEADFCPDSYQKTELDETEDHNE